MTKNNTLDAYKMAAKPVAAKNIMTVKAASLPIPAPTA
ncbi:hypothetical protein IMCC1989_1907 [gamma proteobacterium IMCC1989]|nr:hypothetical protein IMCC1989_1907 [gamma proteobacterium IMCC1989]